MEIGKMKNTTAFGLNPVIIIQNTIKIEAIELREAKNPLVVENSPIKAKANVGKLISGDKNVPSTLLCQENTGVNPAAIFPKKCWSSKPGANNNAIIVSGRRTTFSPSATIPDTMMSPTNINGNLGRFLTINRRCGCIRTKITQKTAKYSI